MGSLGITERIAQFVVSAAFESLPAEAVDLSGRAIMDTVACMIAGVPEPVSQTIIHLVQTEGCSPVAGVIGSGFRTSPLNAALANGVLGHALDFDDTNDSSLGHLSVVILPAIFALAEERKKSGKDVVTAYAVGFEVAAKVGRGVNIEHYERGWHPTSTLGTFGAAAASAKLLDLDVSQTRMALGVSASLASGVLVNFGTMTKSLHVGQAAHNGLLAAKLAQKGFTANPCVLEIEQGFCDLFCGRENCNWERITENIGNPLDLISPGIIPKLYPSCSLTHPALDIIMELKNERILEPDSIRKVRCGVDYRWVKTLPYHFPDLPCSGLEGKFSMEFCIAVSIAEGKAGIDQFTDEKVNDPKIQSLMKKIEVYTHPDLVDRKSLGMSFTLLEIELQNGEKISRRAGKPKGDPTNPLSWEEICEKYRNCSNRIFSDQVTRESLDLLQKIDKLPDVTKIMGLLCMR